MSYTKLRFGVTSAALTCLLAGYVVAQQATDTTQSGDQASGRSGARSNQATQRQSGQSGSTQRTQLQTRQSTSAQLGRRGQAGGQNQEVEKYLASCLMAKNQAEIELNQFAQQQAENPQIKEFAQQMIQDHQQLGEQLQQLAVGAGEQSGQSSRASSTPQSLNANSQSDAQSSNSRLPGSSGASQTESRTSRSLTATGGSQDSGAIEQLIQIDQQIVQRQNEATREMLQQKQGQEFDEAFLGTVVHAHVHMLAALETIEQQQGGQLTQVAQQARPVVQQHLDHAKQLKEQLKRGGQAGARAERQTPGTQRQRQ